MNDHLSLRAAALHDPKTMVNTAELRALLADYDALLAAGAPKRKAKAKKAATEEAELPAWLPLEAWEAFLAMRVKIKKPATDYAQRLLIAKLGRFRDTGHDPEVVLNQSITGDWQDLYEPKDSKGVARGFDSGTGRGVQVRSFRQQQQDAANQEALARLAGVPTFDPNVIDVEAQYVPG